MRLVVLGSGTSFPHPRRAASAHWIQTDAGAALLDISADAPTRMAEEHLDWSQLDAIWVSHFHLDHVGGLPPYLFGMRSSPVTQQRRKPLRIFGAAGLKKLLATIDQANNYRLFEQPFPLDIVEVEPGQNFDLLPQLHATTFKTPHTPESLAIRLTEQGGSVLVYTSDTGYSDDLAEFARNADLLLMECSFFRDKPVKKHLELKEAMAIAANCSPQKVVLTHLYSEWDGIDLASEAKRIWPGETVEAYDGLRLEI
jgi:ribonuclease BN (tRNA processing enzyme)